VVLQEDKPSLVYKLIYLKGVVGCHPSTKDDLHVQKYAVISLTDSKVYKVEPAFKHLNTLKHTNSMWDLDIITKYSSPYHQDKNLIMINTEC